MTYNPEVRRKSYLKKTYGVTDPSTYVKARKQTNHHPGRWLSRSDKDALALHQCGMCAICGLSDQPLHVDHSHKTGLIRGLLCLSCNVKLARVEQSADWFKQAMEYIQQPPAPKAGITVFIPTSGDTD